MKVVEFAATVGPSGHIDMPPEFAQEIPPGEPLHVVVMWGAPDFDPAWRTAGRERFEAAYAPEDVIYEQLMDDSAVR